MTHPTYETILERIRDAGSDSIHIFGGLYVGGYYLQQVPTELAELILWLTSWRGIAGDSPRRYLEIGAASGGLARILDDFLHFETILVIDDNRHIQAWRRPWILTRSTEYHGDSHGEGCRLWLAEQCPDAGLDLVVIDGDHTRKGVEADTRLVLPHLAPGGLVVFHDRVAFEYERLSLEVRATIGVGGWIAQLELGAIPQLSHVLSIGQTLGLDVFEHRLAAAGTAANQE